MSMGGKQEAARLLWELLCVQATSSSNTVVASALAASPELLRSLSWGLHAGAWGAAGIIQALTHDSPRSAATLLPVVILLLY